MSFYNSPVATRTRFQRKLHHEEIEGRNETGSSCSKSDQSPDRSRQLGSPCSGSGQEVLEVVDVDEYSVNITASKATTENGTSQSKKRITEFKKVDESSVDEFENVESDEIACGGTRQSKRRITEFKEVDELLVDESENVETLENESNYSSEESDGLEEINNIEFLMNAVKSKGYGAADAFKTGDNTYFFYSSDDLDSDDTYNEMENTRDMDLRSLKREEEVDEDFPLFCKYYGITSENQDTAKVDLCPSDEGEEKETDESVEGTSSADDASDELFSSSESEADDSEDSDYVGRKRLRQTCNRKQSPTVNTHMYIVKTGDWASTKRIHRHRGTGKGKIDSRPKIRREIYEGDGCLLAVEKKKTIKYQESENGNGKGGKPRKRKQVSTRKDGEVMIEALLESIMGNGESIEREAENEAEKLSMVEHLLPLQFRFEDSEDESPPVPAYDLEVEGLFEELDFALGCDEIGSYKPPMIENQENDDGGGGDDGENDDLETTQFKLCQKGMHADMYFEDHIGLRCHLCGAVILESKYVIPTLANYAPATSKRIYLYGEKDFFNAEEFYLGGSDGSSCSPIFARGTVWELVRTSIQRNLYPHQQEGFEFLWKNLAGTIELSELEKFDLSGGGGCIISHAPGTGKTLLTIVFIEAFLKKFPNCHPVIIAPSGMLLTWESEFKKWQVGFTFLNLNNDDFASKEMVNGKVRLDKHMVRAMKIRTWANGGSLLGVSYNLFDMLAGEKKKKKKKDEKTPKYMISEKMGKLLLEVPGLVVLDEGHTPRNQRSNIWNLLLKLKTEKRVILSGTPFQNNFGELFNTLRLVRPAAADVIGNEKIFADVIQSRKRGRKPNNKQGNFGYPVNNSIGDEDIDKLKATISPFVHVHKGNILQSKLPGLRDSVVLLNPSPLQKYLIENMETSGSIEYEHKVALMSVHPSLLLHCSNLSEREKSSINKEKLEKMRVDPDEGVKTRFILALIRLSLKLNERVLIFAQYIEPLKLIKEQITGILHLEDGRQVMLMRGKLKLKDRQKIINEFNDQGSDAKVLLASTKCCSEGIHLIGASRVVLLDVVWNPSVERQAISRAYRLGQQKVVYTYHLLTSGTMEEDKYDRQVEKERLSELVFSSSMACKASAEVLDDKILQVMVDQMKDIFKKVSNPKG